MKNRGRLLLCRGLIILSTSLVLGCGGVAINIQLDTSCCPGSFPETDSLDVTLIRPPGVRLYGRLPVKIPAKKKTVAVKYQEQQLVNCFDQAVTLNEKWDKLSLMYEVYLDPQIIYRHLTGDVWKTDSLAVSNREFRHVDCPWLRDRYPNIFDEMVKGVVQVKLRYTVLRAEMPETRLKDLNKKIELRFLSNPGETPLPCGPNPPPFQPEW